MLFRATITHGSVVGATGGSIDLWIDHWSDPCWPDGCGGTE